MTPADQAEKAGRLRQLHHASNPLLLPNVWDVASARLLEQMDFAAVATSSAAVANSLGYPDGERIPKAAMLEAVRRIAGAVRVPLTADMEAGYSASPAAMRQTALELIEAGAVGLNLEDSEAGAVASRSGTRGEAALGPAPRNGAAPARGEGAPELALRRSGTRGEAALGPAPIIEARLLPIELAAEKIAAVRAAATEAGVPLVINARTDAFFLKANPGFDPWEEALRRARAYRAAGADCIFLPGLADLPTVGRLLAACPGPINLLAGPGAPPVAALARAGVARISLGSGPYRAALGLLRRIAADLRRDASAARDNQGDYALLAEYAIPYADLNAWLAPDR